MLCHYLIEKKKSQLKAAIVVRAVNARLPMIILPAAVGAAAQQITSQSSRLPPG
jgi:hypothetical protein